MFRYDSHKLSLTTIFGLNPFNQKFQQKNFVFFTKKIQWSLMLVHIWNEMSNFEQNESCDQKNAITQIFQSLYYVFYFYSK